MKTHRFTVNVANPTGSPTVANLSLEPVTPTKLAALSLELPKGSLEVVRASIALDPCGRRSATRRLVVKLRPHASVDVHALIETESGRKARGIAAMHLVDRRADGRKGGVLLIATNEKVVDPAGKTVGIANPCPLVLAGPPYAVEPGDDPGTRPPSPIATAGAEFDLVVPVTNPTRKPLADVRVYLEHVGACDAQFRAATWNIGELNPKDVFLATWRMKTAGGQSGGSKASVVAFSRRANPVRLTAPIRMVGKRDRSQPKRARTKAPRRG